MPPRGTRGARGARAGRAGRGGASARGASTAAPTSGPPESDGSASVPEAVSVGSTPSVQETAAPAPRPSATPSAAGPSASTSSSSRGTGTRFRPKNVRRDAAERQRLEEERNRDLASKIKQEEREQRAEERRARRGRGRGGAMSQRGFIRRTVTATGPFSGVPLENVKEGKGGFAWAGRSSHRLGDIPHVDSVRYRPRRAHETRVNIDVLSGFAEDVEDPETHYQTFRSGQKSGSLPMGLFRTEPQEEEVKVATTAELEAEEQQSDGDDGDLFVDPLPVDGAVANPSMDIDVVSGDDNEVWHAAPKSAVKVKAEPGTEGDDAMDVDLSEIPPAPSSPEEQQKKAAITASAADAEKEKRRERALQDPEVQHTVLDVQTLLQELRLYKEGDEQSGQLKDGRLYLFQFPPVLPPLEKPEEQEEGGESYGAEGQPADAERPTPVSQPKVKKEEGDANTTAQDENPLSSSAFSSTLPPEGGRVGKLIVRRSGCVEMDWGGTRLALGMGAEAEFLTSAVVLETREHPDNPEALTGTGYGMGQVMGRFVLTPVWDDEGDWEPDLARELADDADGNVDINNDGGDVVGAT